MRVRWERCNTFEIICLLLLEIIFAYFFATPGFHLLGSSSGFQHLLSDCLFLGMEVFHTDF